MKERRDVRNDDDDDKKSDSEWVFKSGSEKDINADKKN